MRLVDISVSKRLWAAVAVPMLAAGYIAYAQSSERLETYRGMSSIVTVSQEMVKIGGVVHSLQIERGLTTGFLTSRGTTNGPELRQARTASDSAMAGFADAMNTIMAAVDTDLSSARRSLEDKLARITALRASVDQLSANGQDVFTTYTSAISEIIVLADRLSNLTSNAEIALLMSGYVDLMQAKEAAGQERAFGNAFIIAGQADPARFGAFASFAGEQEALIASAFSTQDESQRAQYERMLADVSPVVEDFRDKIVGKGLGAPLEGLESKTWFAATTKRIDTLKEIESQNLKDIGEQALAAAAAAYRDFLTLVVVCLAGGLMTLALSGLMAMTVVRPIGRMVGAMRRLASGDLDFGPVTTGRKDEIGEMEQAVQIFQEAAVRNKELEEAEAERRAAAERERIAMQQKADAEAEARLVRATEIFAASMKRLAAGDMMCELQQPLDSHFEGLRQDFNASVRQLRETLQSVGISISTVAGGSREVSSASDDLSRRTEQQAASLEETAAALEEITANVSATSKRAAEARQVVRDAEAKAGQAGAVVENAVLAMERIEHAARQIGQIISVIDEIAFQTNLLALNAGVEAARAGDAGKGFAVVAQEVRELAQRSAKAAREIKELVGNSEAAVGEGVRLVSDTGTGLGEITELVQLVTRHMEAIATAAQEQSAGLLQINSAVNHMDQATQQNAAMVEEMNAASATLAHEGTTLNQLLAQFQLGSSEWTIERQAA
ncbi:methyl-accepting chemotaxis protein (plasmid) [Neorhizobium sp. SOG26]|uniref:methyl-accepting chemotaxis protein n=1 Tax=Neorhizobium sp. SOG26 TaxID=2060726 RepID=UPI000E594EB4|nr:methyl-accepting chemotaxis protein [Neorhizobium sp. SOG26]AXV17648.1 methyl-accepting chemotaxis protein [Neorhizobium sp. SOG26]